MSEIAIRFTHRQTFGPDQSIEHTIDVEQIPTRNDGEKPAGAVALLTVPSTLSRGLSVSAELESKTGYTKILADGTQLPGTDPRTDHVAVIDHATGLMVAVESLGDPADPDSGIPQEQCIERCKQFRLLGYDDWHLATRAEAIRYIDDSRQDPAIDTSLFPRVKPRLHWTSTAAAWSSASAWFVHFSGGYVSYYHRGYGGFALAVRRAGQ